MEKNNQIKELLRSYLDNDIDKDSFKDLMNLLNELEDSEFKQLVENHLQELEQQEVTTLVQAHLHKTQITLNKRLRSDLSKKNNTTYLKKLWMPIAAAIALFFIFRYSTVLKKDIVKDQTTVSNTFDISPAQNKATITFDNQIIELNASQQGIDIYKDSVSTKNGTKMALRNQKSQQIRIATPRGGQYQITLLDGTKVWLNAESELSYNGSFGKSNRDVQIKGEVYFEVKKNQKLPFIVSYAQQKLIVLGTTFNINAYDDDDNINSTLIEGSMKILTANHPAYVLKPNQQLEYTTDNQGLKLKQVDPSTVISWKNGVFDFQGMNLSQAMRIISRWYDVDVRYPDNIPNIVLGGKMSRGVKLTTFLSFLEDNFGISTSLSKNGVVTITP